MKKFKVLIADDIEIIAQTNKKIAEKNDVEIVTNVQMLKMLCKGT